MSMHPKELETTMQLPAKKCYDYFIKKIVDFEEVWSLRNEKGWVMSEDDYRVPQLHFWPTEEHAAFCAIDQWEKTVPEMIDLDDFIEEWLPGMLADGINPSIFYNRNNSLSIEIQTLKEDIEEELKNY
ncbi:DUF2750 domain-containing protein [Bacillus altitudinis]|uniref:DUF2750 domain-containing protein n=1 Tax=Bacillus altitudinis TaxID=293387 RepID=UPI0020A791F4|nr:DUF2750 domain-containing protein [Bacillus altitudinis]USY50010.1 DUF2750 domain-containing protein [Bacillus altitudinis]